MADIQDIKVNVPEQIERGGTLEIEILLPEDFQTDEGFSVESSLKRKGKLILSRKLAEFRKNSKKREFFEEINLQSSTPKGVYQLEINFLGIKSSEMLGFKGPFDIEIVDSGNVVEQESAPVSLVRTKRPVTEDVLLWQEIKNRRIDFNEYSQLIDYILDSGNTVEINDATLNPRNFRKRLPFVGVEQYSIVKFATEAYMLAKANLLSDYLESYLKDYKGAKVLPYYDLILNQLNDMNLVRTESVIDEIEGVAFVEDTTAARETTSVADSVRSLPMISLIWSLWMEMGMIVQTLNAISLRFQNVRGQKEVEPLNRLDIDPLRPMNALFWGYVQDERNRLTLRMRNNEYLHVYGIGLMGKAVPQTQNADNRSKFLEAFNNLLHSASIFFKETDDTTRVADGFPVLNNLREVHLLLAEGNHNAYGNLTWTARQEMMMQQYLLGRPEMREFLGGRVMVPYPEKWMDRVDTMRQLQGWGSTSISYFYDLATFGEQIVLGIRYGNWSVENNADAAANWANAFRNEIQRYIHSYRTVTGVDLSADAMDSNAMREGKFLQPAWLIQRRVMAESQQTAGLQNGIYSRVTR